MKKNKITAELLALYMGCKVQTPDGIGKLVGVEIHGLDGGLQIAHIKFPKWQKITRYQNPKEKDSGTKNHYHTSDVKPILRPLESMTKEEMDVASNLSGFLKMVKSIPLVRKSIEEPASIIKDEAKHIRYLFSCGFDLGLLPEGTYLLKEEIKKATESK
jgi:hypothetical protein